MTWKEFKDAVDAEVPDEAVLDYIDVSSMHLREAEDLVIILEDAGFSVSD